MAEGSTSFRGVQPELLSWLELLECVFERPGRLEDNKFAFGFRDASFFRLPVLSSKMPLLQFFNFECEIVAMVIS